jgi:HSP20 family protein
MPRKKAAIHLHRLQGQIRDVAYELTKVHFSRFRTAETWRPPINAYRCERCIRICVDLAGVERSAIDLRLQPGRLTIRGRRGLPEPDHSNDSSMTVLAMEIDHGAFEREIELPMSVEREGVTAEQRNGMLWIHLPLRAHA